MKVPSSFRNLDMYRKIPRDLTQGSTSGAWLSIAATFFMTLLFVLELNAYLTKDIVSSIVMDEGKSTDLQINFNITFPRLSCRHAGVDVSNVMGVHQINITRNVRKFVLNGKTGLVVKEIADSASIEAPVVDTLSEDQLKRYETAENAAALTSMADFQKLISDNKIVLINFYAPWCFWSQKLRPTWEYMASIVDRLPYFTKVKIAKVDCTQQGAHENLCHANHINAFPTIIVFKNGATHSHEHYHGDRTADSFTKYIKAAMVEVGMDPMQHVKRRALEDKGVQPAAEATPPGSVPVVNAIVPSAGPDGCNLSGFVLVSKVPGNFHISAHSPGFSFDPETMNMTHTVHHLTFGSIVDKTKFYDSVPQKFWSEDWMDGITYLSESKKISHEHYLKVVSNHYEALGADELVTTYKYTYNSNEYAVTDELPEARFSYDISPMAVKLTETSKPFYHFITNVCAIIGGLFTVLGLLDSVVYHGINSFQKKVELGKVT